MSNNVGQGSQITTGGIPASAALDTIKVNGAIVANPFSFTALVNNVGPVGVTKVNGLPVAENRPCMIDNTFNVPARTTGVVYQNTSQYPIYVSAALVLSNTPTTITAFVGSTPSPATQVWIGVTGGTLSNPTFFVPAGQYYEITISTGTATVNGWREFICQNGTITDSGDIHASRSLSTIFQNNTSNTLFVVIQVTGVSVASLVQAVSDPVSSPTSVVDSWFQNSGGNAPITLFFIVPPYHYYKATAASGSLSLWHEYSWNISCQRSQDLMNTVASFAAPRTQTVFTGRFGSSNVAIGNTAATFQNTDPFRTRWVQILNTSSQTSSTIQFFTGDCAFPFLQLSFAGTITAPNSPKVAKGPIPPLHYYQMCETEQAANTLTNQHWWEYQLG